MKLKLLILLPVTLLLTGCSITNQSPAEAQVTLGCQSFERGYKANGYKMPVEAARRFAEAARLDAGYIPLAQAAQTLAYDPFSDFVDVNYYEKRFDASQLVQGVCVQ